MQLATHLQLQGTRGSVVGWDTMLQAGRSPVRVPDKVDFFNLPCKKRPVRKADNSYEPNVWKYGSLNLSQP
jgi:hypothetical protein